MINDSASKSLTFISQDGRNCPKHSMSHEIHFGRPKERCDTAAEAVCVIAEVAGNLFISIHKYILVNFPVLFESHSSSGEC